MSSTVRQFLVDPNQARAFDNSSRVENTPFMDNTFGFNIPTMKTTASFAGSNVHFQDDNDFYQQVDNFWMNDNPLYLPFENPPPSPHDRYSNYPDVEFPTSRVNMEFNPNHRSALPIENPTSSVNASSNDNGRHVLGTNYPTPAPNASFPTTNSRVLKAGSSDMSANASGHGNNTSVWGLDSPTPSGSMAFTDNNPPAFGYHTPAVRYNNTPMVYDSLEPYVPAAHQESDIVASGTPIRPMSANTPMVYDSLEPYVPAALQQSNSVASGTPVRTMSANTPMAYDSLEPHLPAAVQESNTMASGTPVRPMSANTPMVYDSFEPYVPAALPQSNSAPSGTPVLPMSVNTPMACDSIAPYESPVLQESSTVNSGTSVRSMGFNTRAGSSTTNTARPGSGTVSRKDVVLDGPNATHYELGDKLIRCPRAEVPTPNNGRFQPDIRPSPSGSGSVLVTKDFFNKPFQPSKLRYGFNGKPLVPAASMDYIPLTYVPRPAPPKTFSGIRFLPNTQFWDLNHLRGMPISPIILTCTEVISLSQRRSRKPSATSDSLTN
jgi:hypothetical protein